MVRTYRTIDNGHQCDVLKAATELYTTIILQNSSQKLAQKFATFQSS